MRCCNTGFTSWRRNQLAYSYMPMQHGAWQSAEEQMYGRLEWMTMLLAASNNMSPS